MKKYIGCAFSSFARINTSAHILHTCNIFLLSVRHLSEECRQKNEIKNVIRVYIEMWIQYLCIRIELIQTHKNCVRARTFDFFIQRQWRRIYGKTTKIKGTHTNQADIVYSSTFRLDVIFVAFRV